MSVQNGQQVSAQITNAALMSRLNDTSTVGRVDVNNTTDSTDPTTGAIHTTGGLGVEQNANVGLSLTVQQNAVVGGTLDVAGNSILNDVTATNVTATGLVQGENVTANDTVQANAATITTTATVGTTLDVGTDALVGGTLGVTGNTSLSTVSSSGLATLNSAQVTNNATVGGTLGVTGNTSLSTVSTTGLASLQSAQTTAGLTVGTTLQVNGNATIVGNLEVQGTTTTVSSTVVTVADQNITLNQGGTDLSAEGAGITIDRAGTDGSLIYKDTSASKWAAGPLGSEVDLVDVSSSQTLTNKTIDGSLNTITNVTATGFSGTLPIANGGTGQTTAVAAFDALAPSTTKGDLIVHNGTDNVRLPVGSNNQVLVADSAEAAGVKWTTANFGGGGGATNIIENGDAEAGIQIWTPYNDSSTTRPVDGTGGTATVNAAFLFSPAIRGTKSFVLDKPASNCQGQGWAIPSVTLDPDFRAKPLQFTFSYRFLTNGFTAGANGSSPTDGDAIVYFYDLTNNKLVEPSNIKFFSSSTTVTDTFSCTVQFDYNTLAVRPIVHVASTSTTAWQMVVDAIVLGPELVTQATLETNWVEYVPTFINAGTVTENQFQYRLQGPDLIIQGSVRFGTVAVGPAVQMTLPSGFTIDTTLAGSSPYKTYGTASRIPANSNVAIPIIINTATSVFVGYDGASTLYNNNDYVQINARFPIVGQSGSVKISEPYDGRRLSLKYTSSATTAITGTDTQLTFGNRVWDDAGLWNGTELVIPTAGEWEITLLANLASASWTNGAFIGTVWVNGAFRTVVSQYFSVNGSPVAQNVTMHGSARIQVNAQDIVRIYAYQTQTASINLSGSTTLNTLEIRKVDQSQAIAAGEKILVMVNQTSGQSIPSGVDQTVVFNNVARDTHGIYNASTGRIKLNRAASGQVKTTIFMDTFTPGSAFTAYAIVYKNGVAYKVISYKPQAAVGTSFYVMADGSSCDIDGVSGDEFWIAVFHNTGTNRALRAAGNSVWADFMLD